MRLGKLAAVAGLLCVGMASTAKAATLDIGTTSLTETLVGSALHLDEQASSSTIVTPPGTSFSTTDLVFDATLNGTQTSATVASFTLKWNGNTLSAATADFIGAAVNLNGTSHYMFSKYTLNGNLNTTTVDYKVTSPGTFTSGVTVASDIVINEVVPLPASATVGLVLLGGMGAFAALRRRSIA